MAEQATRPKRRDLRIARQEAERRTAELSTSDISLPSHHTSPAASCLSAGTPFVVANDVVSEKQMPVASDAEMLGENEAETLVIPQAILAQPKKSKKRWMPYLSAASVAMIVAASAVLSIDGQSARADARGDSDKTSSREITQDSGTTPPSLLFNSASADVARYYDYQSEYSGETYTCQVPSGASSLSNLFMEQAQVVVDPMASGTYRLTSG